MCRIFGSFAAGTAAGTDRPEPAPLMAVSARQRHGGPDEHQVLSGPGWSLGCDRLAVTDPRGGQQPYRLPHLPGVLAVLNGEIYNHTALRRALAARGHRFPDRCDGTLLPALYAEYGPAFAEHLDGMFAVAVLDLRPGRTQLVLAVDDMGMKPVHLHHDPHDGSTRFASEIPALLAFEGVRISPREDSLDTVLATRTSFSTHTALDGVSVLPPGATALVRPGAAPVVRRRGPHRAAPAGDTQDVLRHEVRRLARADVPVCAITSGGLDSGLVTALAAEHARETDAPPLHTFHLTYRGRWPDSEAAYARSVARRARTVHHEVAVDPDEIGSLLTRTVRHLGQPNADPIALSTYALFRAVRENGFTVALTGDGADELFGGYDRMRAALAAPTGADWAGAYADALSAAPRLLREHLYTSHYRAFIADQGSAADRIEQELRSAEAIGEDRLTATTAFETRWRLPAYHLRRVDHLSMAWAVEARMPFCQPAVVSHARSLPTGARTGKRALYEAGAELLPSAVLRRPKQPFTLPLAAMLAPGSPLLDTVRELLSPARLVLGGKVRADRVQKLLARHLERPSHHDAQALWALAVHELWTDVVRSLSIPVGCAA
ncbi:asparagine synthase (glutamine-hydrolyzing) [Streptomyces venezuelae]|uniref:asparagine synthase (glutamine-hydrolyzing) n=1 Tax=Streptomyces venezuelae TaxID=54571 RepID=UPI00123852CD|nr:asparagine synthase (glutamine-hydrolyzing) [Streptomyces venezuelae]QES07577.1 asparagine synthase (glutamine-hydrolyzing) [Streptomyces venezuelae]